MGPYFPEAPTGVNRFSIAPSQMDLKKEVPSSLIPVGKIMALMANILGLEPLPAGAPTIDVCQGFVHVPRTLLFGVPFGVLAGYLKCGLWHT